MKRILAFVVVLAILASILQLAPSPPRGEASDGLQAICVPWQSSDPSIPHYTYSGAQTTLKAIARGDATEYRWDFGDGSSATWQAITDPYNLGVQHTYTGVVGTLLLATLSVRDTSGNTVQDTYPVQIFVSSNLCDPAQLDVRVNMAIDEGLWWLHTTMVRDIYGSGSPGYDQPYGYWLENYYGYPLAATGTSVDAFQLHGHRANGDYSSDPYVETVQRALNYLLCNTYAYAIDAQPAGSPDTNGNGIGLVTNHSSELSDPRQTYIGGICMTALASSGTPGRAAAVGGDYVYGRTFAAIVQDMVDFFAWGQSDPDTGSARGGWRYYANYGNSDMSTTQWPPLAMLAAEQNMGATVPQFVRDELLYFLNYTQNTDLSDDNGGFGYAEPWSLLNIIKAAAGIICHEFVGTPLTDSRVERAIGYIYRHWNDTGGSWDDQQLHGNSYGMYGVMKALRIPEPDIARATEYDYVAGGQTANSFDWYYTPCSQTHVGLASYVVNTQQADGSWDDVVGGNPVGDAFCTGWRILILLKGVTMAPPVAVICDCDEQEYNLNQDIHLDGACSYHPTITRRIVLYEWDFDYDGTFETDVTGPTAALIGGYAVTGVYPVALRVTDDNPEEPQTSIYVCAVSVHPPPHCPHAFAGGPYIGWMGQPVTFDAATSWDPDNEIVSYEWDLDNDGLFGAADGNCFGAPSDAIGINPQWTWDGPYYGVVGLMVIDAAEPYGPCSDVDYDTVEIGNHPPVADPGGPYVAGPNACITLDGTDSYDPDTGDPITWAWDLDGDGQYDDFLGASFEFCVGPSPGTVYDICLWVEDSFGLHDIACTTVTVGPGEPPAARVDPESQCVDYGAGFSVDILVDPAGYRVSGGEVNIAFDPSAMSANDIAFGDLFGTSPLVGAKQIDNGNGTILYALGRVGTTPPPTATGVFATISFTAKNVAGTFPIDISSIYLADETFEDIVGIVPTDGTVTIPCESGTAVTLDVTCNLGVSSAVFGIDPMATDGYDSGLDEVAPPAPPEGQDAFFWYPANSPSEAGKLFASYVPPAASIVWPLKVNYITMGPAESDVTISWNLLETSTLPVSGLFLIDPSSGAHVNMREASSYTFHAVVPAGQGSAMYSFEITTEMCFDLQLKQGWNLMSLPLDPGVSTPAEVLAGTNYMSIWTWDAALKRYVLPEQMVPSRGYWVLVPADTTLSLCGVPVGEYTVDVPAGWSLIGSIPQVGGVSTVPPDVTQATLYAWDPVLKRYVSATVVEPGKGYWLLAFQPCTVTVEGVL